MIQEIFKRKINYYLGNDEDKKISVFQADVDYDKLYQLIKEIPSINREETFDIIRIKKDLSNEKGFFPDLSSVLEHSAISNRYFSILSFDFQQENIAETDFFSSDSLSSTDAYDVFVKWEEKPELVIYLSEFLADGRAAKAIDLNLSKIVENISILEIYPLEQQNLFQDIFSCFDFSHIEDISYDTINSVRLASCYDIFDLSSPNTHLQKIYEIGKNNSIALNYSFLADKNEEKVTDTRVTIQSAPTFIEEEMLKNTNSFGNIAAFYQDYQELKNDHYFMCTILNDNGDLYRYRGLVDYLGLYQWINKINKKYSVLHKEKFDIIPWDCYKKIPILDNYLDPAVVENNYYKITNVDLSEGKIDVRKRIATNISIEWEEVPEISIAIDKFLSDFVKKPEIDLSSLVQTIDSMDVEKEEKTQIVNQLFSYFNLTLLEIVPSTIICMIQETPTSTSVNLDKAKNRLGTALSVGTSNNESLSLLEENKIQLKKDYKQN